MSAFLRHGFRSTRTIQNQIRRYATEPPKSGGSSTAIIGVLGLVGAAGGFYYYQQSKGAAPSPSELADKAGIGSTAKTAFTGGDQGFLSLKLAEVQTLTHNTKKLRFELPEPDMESGLHVASAVLTKYKGPEMEKPVMRPYTPTSDTDAKGHLDFVIKKYPNGPMSTHLHDMQPGQRLDIKGPLPKYPWSPNKHDHVVMIAGGTGITPMWQVANAIFKNPADNTKVTLVFGNVSEDDILLKRELEDLENEYPQRFRAFYVLDNPPKDWNGGKGFVTKELLKTVCPDPKMGDKLKIFVCGPPGLYKAISGGKKSPQDQGELTGLLADLGYSKDQVYKF